MPGSTTHRAVARHTRRNANRNGAAIRRHRRAPTSIAYFDVKPGEVLSIGGRRITLGVRQVGRDGSAIAEVHSPFHEGSRRIRRGQYMRLDRAVGVFNYGNRHHGRRMHIRVELIGEPRPSIEKLPWSDVEETAGEFGSGTADSGNHKAAVPLGAGIKSRRR